MDFGQSSARQRRRQRCEVSKLAWRPRALFLFATLPRQQATAKAPNLLIMLGFSSSTFFAGWQILLRKSRPLLAAPESIHGLSCHWPDRAVVVKSEMLTRLTRPGLTL